ncbi:MAG: CRISPR-associated protein Cas4 [Thermoplasmata archaeon]|nr:CRISPR-associated protein Cas4 [Thermoplasmata archaeon]
MVDRDSSPMAQSPVRTISAGDLEKFSYCPLSWWLSRDFDEDDDHLKKGIEEHEKLGESLWEIDAEEKAAKQSETMVFWYAVIASIMAVIGLEVLHAQADMQVSEILGVVALIWVLAAAFALYRASRSNIRSKVMDYEKIILIFAIIAVILAINSVAFIIQDVRLGQALEIASIVWLIGASYFLYRSLKSSQTMQSLREEFRVKGKIEYIDIDHSKVFRSESNGLSGRPDYVIRLDNEGETLIPVEEKKGRTPRGPLFSHIMQLAAYCLLIEETTGIAPPYGILKYPEQEHQIEYNEDMKKALLEKLAEMRRVKDAGQVHRNHNRPGKCRSCSRRSVCPERLD